LYGPRTEAAVIRFQAAAQVAPDGIVGPRTRSALTRAQKEPLRRGAGFAQPDGSPRVRALQVRLQRHGLRPGPIDGLFGPLTQAAVQRLQRSEGVPVNGVVTARTRQLLADAGNRTDEAAQTPTEEPAQTPADEPAQTAQPDATRDEPPKVAATPAAAETDDEGGVGVPIVVLIGIVALLLGLLAGALLGRRNRVNTGTAVPLAQGVTVEGVSKSKSVGRFRGNVHALVLGRRGMFRNPEARYLVSDPAKEDPFWVSQDEVSGLMPPAHGRAFDRQAKPVRALGYVSVATDGENGEFDTQMSAIDLYCEERGWELVEVVRDVEQPSNGNVERQGLLYALEKIGRGEASCIIVSELGRLSGSAADLGGILDRLRRSDGRLVALDIGLDTASAEGRVAAQALASVGGWAGDRNRHGIAAAAAEPAVAEPAAAQDVPALKSRIAAMRAEGMTLQAIADVLNSEGVPTLRGGAMWRPSSVQSASGYRRPPRRQDE
jgi:peptidoglycan hydrolase-like protein with peptidoglycan-binding domain/DNA invertase Pin-like site-specific DNA recombinase